MLPWPQTKRSYARQTELGMHAAGSQRRAESLPASSPIPGESCPPVGCCRYFGRRRLRTPGIRSAHLGRRSLREQRPNWHREPGRRCSRRDRTATVGEAMAKDTKQHNGIEYAPRVVGKFLFRVREAYVAGPAADLVRSRRVGALKLDLVLRGLALLPVHAGSREAGHVLRHRRLSYELFHDLCRDPERFALDAPHDIDDDAAVREKKRTWVREQLQALEARQLVRRSTDPDGRRPDITVLSDRCDGEPFDDPGATATAADGYLTISGAVISSPLFRGWGAPEVVAYLCAMTADRFARHRHHKHTGEATQPGSATWFRQDTSRIHSRPPLSNADSERSATKASSRPRGPPSTPTPDSGSPQDHETSTSTTSQTSARPRSSTSTPTGPPARRPRRWVGVQGDTSVRRRRWRSRSGWGLCGASGAPTGCRTSPACGTPREGSTAWPRRVSSSTSTGGR